MNKVIPIRQVDDCWNRIGVWSRNTQRCEKLAEHIHCYNCDVYTQSGRQLLNRPIPQGYQEEWNQFLSERHGGRIKGLESALVIRLGAEWLGIPVGLIKEITLMRPIIALPHNTRKVIRGLVNMRGELTICLSMGALLGIRKPDDDWEEDEHSIQRLIVVNLSSGDVVFPVSEVYGITRYEKSDVASPPTTANTTNVNFVEGIIVNKGNDVGILDGDKVINTILDVLK